MKTVIISSIILIGIVLSTCINAFFLFHDLTEISEMLQFLDTESFPEFSGKWQSLKKRLEFTAYRNDIRDIDIEIEKLAAALSDNDSTLFRYSKNTISIIIDNLIAYQCIDMKTIF